MKAKWSALELFGGGRMKSEVCMITAGDGEASWAPHFMPCATFGDFMYEFFGLYGMM